MALLTWNFLTDEVDPGALLLDCRSEEQYSQGTLARAVGAAFVKKPYGSGPASMSKLSGYLIEIKKRAGDRPVICFDEGEGMYASRLAWLLMGMGLPDVRLLGIRSSDFTKDMIKPGTEQIESGPTDVALPLKGIVTIGFLQQNLTRVQLIDVRTPEEYEGVLPRMTNPEPGSVCGRIPGSINWDWRLLYGPEGHLKTKMAIIMDIKRIGLIQERPTVLYDFNGARSCTAALLLSRCGHRQVQVYLGSWMEWRKSSMPKQNMRKYG
ncbi:MAG: thiosulfate sulfurtransferase [Spirochaetia bacterium]|nr:thiosulfate sulfurtransferase [Spirochaetia bacterium]